MTDKAKKQARQIILIVINFRMSLGVCLASACAGYASVLLPTVLISVVFPMFTNAAASTRASGTSTAVTGDCRSTAAASKEKLVILRNFAASVLREYFLLYTVKNFLSFF